MFHCPKCGKLSFNFDGSKIYRCEACDYQFFFNSAATAGAIVLNNGELLTAVRAHDPGAGLLDLPGGFVDPNESLEEALVRELHEELNICPTSIRYFSSAANRYLFDEVDYSTCDAFFICEFDHFDGMKANDDISDYRWVKLDHINLSDFAFDSVKKIIEKLVLSEKSP